MKRASLTEAKNGLSALLAQVRSGETIVITDRDVPIARLEAMTSRPGAEAGGRLARLQRSGVLRPPRVATPDPRLATAPPASPSGTSVLATLLEERRSAR